MNSAPDIFSNRVFKIGLVIPPLFILLNAIFYQHINASLDFIVEILAIAFVSLIFSFFTSAWAYYARKFSKTDILRLLFYFPFLYTVLMLVIFFIAINQTSKYAGIEVLAALIVVGFSLIFVGFYTVMVWLMTFYEIYRIRKTGT